MNTPPRGKNVRKPENARNTEPEGLEETRTAVIETIAVAEEVRAIGLLLVWYADYSSDDMDDRVVRAGAACVERMARRISDDLDRVQERIGVMMRTPSP
jgi:hypothetical protein